MTLISSSFEQYECYSPCNEEEIVNAIKAAKTKQYAIIKKDDGFVKYSGRKGECSSIPVEVKVIVKTPKIGPPPLSEDDKFLLFKEWRESNHRRPHPGEMYQNLNVDLYFNKCYKQKEQYEKIKELIEC